MNNSVVDNIVDHVADELPHELSDRRSELDKKLSTHKELARPWERAWYLPTKGKWPIFLHLVIIHVLALIGLIMFPIPGWKLFAAWLVVNGLGGLGTTVVYHRALSHRTVKMNKIIEHLLIFFTMFNGSGAPGSWVAFHRRHHIKSDTPEDISSPTHGGFWWAHLRWLYQGLSAPIEIYCPDLDKGMYKFWRHAEMPVIILSYVCGLPWGLKAFFWMGAIRLCYSLHGQCLVNSLTHLGKYPDGDSSMNVWWLGPFQIMAWGENWHRNHHSQAGSARLGLKWYQIDIGWYFIFMCEKLGLAWDVKRPRKIVHSIAA